ncbi:MAG: tetratricopeptide repeat protein [Deltaproteobacteria bacterium]|nr:tetratricopeptide repeat protein [Deltaproteobacteria bacterium]
MGTRAWVVVAVLALASSASADPKGDITSKTKEAMENYDLMDYDAAKKSLNQALATAKKAKLDKDPVTARVYLNLGLAAFAGGDVEGAKVAFVSAVQIDPKIQIEPAYKSPELTKLLDEARAGGKAAVATDPGPVGGDPIADVIDCASVKGFQHTIIDTAPGAAPQPIEALVGADITPVKVSAFYRVEGATDFTEVKLSKQGDCKYTGALPATAMKGSLIHYYVAALDGNSKAIAAKGSAGSPNILEITAPVKKVVATKDDVEDPINGKVTRSTEPTGGEISGGVIAGGKRPKIMVTLAGGTGFGYVSGNTEGGNMVQECCVGNSYVVLIPELGYQVNDKLSVGIAGRIGLPLGANVNAEGSEGHSSIAPGVLFRVRYALSPTGEGIRVMGQVGGGVMRNTIKLTTTTPGMDTDIVGQGPLLVGGGIGFLKKLSGKVSFVADLSALAGIAVVDKISGVNVNTGIGADLSLGLAIGF